MKVQHQSTKVCRELWEQKGSKAQGPLKDRKYFHNTFIYPRQFQTISHLASKEQGCQQANPAVQGVQVRLWRSGVVMAVKSCLESLIL